MKKKSIVWIKKNNRFFFSTLVNMTPTADALTDITMAANEKGLGLVDL